MKKALLFLFAFGGILSSAIAAPENSLVYSGNLRRADGTAIPTDSSFAMTFRIYDRDWSGNSSTNDIVYWARRAPVSFKANGDFTVKLTDETGTLVSGAKYSRLVECGSLNNWYVSLQVQGCRELKTRVLIARQHFAFHAASASMVSNVTASAIFTDELKANANLAVRNFTFNKIVGGIGADGKPVKPEIKVSATNNLAISSNSGFEYTGDILGVTNKTLCHEDADIDNSAPTNGVYTLKSDAIVLGLDRLKKIYFSMPIPSGYKFNYRNIPASPAYSLFSRQSDDYIPPYWNDHPYWPKVVYEIYSFGKQDWDR